jgi:hypothetical protein
MVGSGDGESSPLRQSGRRGDEKSPPGSRQQHAGHTRNTPTLTLSLRARMVVQVGACNSHITSHTQKSPCAHVAEAIARGQAALRAAHGA